MSIVIEMPDPVLRAMRVPEQEVPERVKRELAVRLYAKRLLGFGKARELAGMTVWEFQKLLGDEDIPRDYDEEALAEDVRTLEELA